MPTLILSPRYTTDSIALAKAAGGLGWPVQRLLSWHFPDNLSADNVALYGEPFFAAAIAEQLSLHLLEPPCDWPATLPTRYSKRRVFCTTLEKARLVADQAFIKPADDKCFPAGVYSSGAELYNTEHLSIETPVLVSEPVKWEVEYRGFIQHNQLCTLSPYFRNGKLVQTEDGKWPAAEEEVREASDFYTLLLRDEEVKLPPGVVVDIGMINGRGWAVVEANPAWSSGIYGCAPSQVIPAVQSACVRMDTIPDAHRQWIINRTD